jgi:hypothetical protein
MEWARIGSLNGLEQARPGGAWCEIPNMSITVIETKHDCRRRRRCSEKKSLKK